MQRIFLVFFGVMFAASCATDPLERERNAYFNENYGPGSANTLEFADATFELADATFTFNTASLVFLLPEGAGYREDVLLLVYDMPPGGETPETVIEEIVSAEAFFAIEDPEIRRVDEGEYWAELILARPDTDSIIFFLVRVSSRDDGGILVYNFIKSASLEKTSIQPDYYEDEIGRHEDSWRQELLELSFDPFDLD